MPSKRQKDLLAPLPPAFPLSSPITEEVPSPPGSSPEGHELERTRPFEFLVKATRQRSQRRKEGHRSVNFSHRDRDGKRVSIGGITKKRNAAKPVGLNLVTDFSQTGSTAPPRADANAAPFVDLNDLKLLSKAREKERFVQNQNGKTVSKNKKTTTAGGFYRLPDESSVDVNIQQGPANPSYIDSTKARLEAHPNNPFRDQYELSPSDRNVVIGLTVPSNGALHLDQLKTRDLDSAGDQATTPLTPSIIVTPAFEEAPWQTPSPETPRPRATSSVYSRFTTIFEHPQSDIPPVPAIPVLHAAKDIDTNPSASTRNRSLSTGTVFEEDSPQEKKPSRLSVNTESNRPQSQGWWTYLLSPLLSRSNTFSSKKSPTSPGFSISPRTVRSKVSTKDWWEKEVSCFSPDSPEAVAPSSREKNLEQSRSLSGDGEEVAPAVPTNRDNMMSMAFPGRPIQGLAAEYYQACAHELFSKTPFFECQDHVCSITPVNVVGNDEAVPGDRGLALVEVDTPNAGLQDRGVPAEETKNGTRGLLIDVDSPRPDDGGTKGATKSPGSATSTDSWASTAVDTPEQEKSLSQTKGVIEEPPVPVPVPQPRSFESEKQAPTPVAAPSPQIINTFSPPVNNVHYPPPVAHSPFQPAPAMEKEVQYGPVYPPGHGTPFGQQASPNPTWVQEHSRAPEPVSPGFQQQTEGTRSIPMNDMQVPAPAYTQYQRDDSLPPRYALHPSPGAAVMDPNAPRGPGENHRRRLEREDAIGRQVGGLWRGRGPVSKRGCFGRPGREGRVRRRWYFGICIFFLVIVVVAISLALTLTKHGDTTPVQSQWLNLTGYPPMPTGIATIAGPEPQVQRSACIAPTSMWSCALPKGEPQSANMPYAANSPNFRVEIRFLNGTYNHSTSFQNNSTLRVRTDSGSFDPSPSPPSLADQTFLGNTTDGNVAPYAGEDTPFYMTIMSPAQVSSNALFRRSSSSSSTPSETFNLSDIIPAPDETSDGLPAAATLYPLPASQPVRLYNRGMPTEHYGFYTYFDRSIFLESESPLNGGTSDTSANDTNGGSAQSSAKVRCTWSQTRFLVQIWTQPGKLGYNLISGGSTGTVTSTTASATPTATSTTPTSSSSATDFTRPGSFPYPVTITVDRHGGNEDQKLVYCYGVEEDGHYNVTNHKLEIEDRGVGGTLINPAGSSEKDGSYGGVDGGTGGCECQWTNWIGSV